MSRGITLTDLENARKRIIAAKQELKAATRPYDALRERAHPGTWAEWCKRRELPITHEAQDL